MTQTQSRKKNLFQMNVDLMHGPIFRSLVLFMLPILISNLFQQLYNTVDTMIVGNVLGDTALAAIGSCGAIYELLVGFGLGIGNGLAIVAARAYGAQDEDLLKRTVAGSLVIGLCASFVITTAGFFGLRPLLQLLDTPAEILEDAYRYIIVIDLGVLVMFLYNLCAGLLRAIGNSVMPLVFLLISSGLNVALDLWFIAGLGMGVQGAAVATVIAQGISVVLCILYVMRRVPLLLPARKHWAVGQHLYWELFSQSISMGLMSSIVSAGSVVLQYGINGLGTLTIAGHTAARKLFSFTNMPLISMANAGSTFVSQNRGAAQPERVRKGMRTMYLCSVVIMAADIVLMQLFARQLVQQQVGQGADVQHMQAALAVAELHHMAQDADHQHAVVLFFVHLIGHQPGQALLLGIQHEHVLHLAQHHDPLKGAAHVVGHTQVVGTLDVGRVLCRRDHDHRDLVQPGIAAHDLQHVKAVHLRHHDVQQHQCDVRVLAQKLHRPDTVFRFQILIPVAQDLHQQRAVDLRIVCDQDLLFHIHVPCSSPSPSGNVLPCRSKNPLFTQKAAAPVHAGTAACRIILASFHQTGAAAPPKASPAPFPAATRVPAAPQAVRPVLHSRPQLLRAVPASGPAPALPDRQASGQPAALPFRHRSGRWSCSFLPAR